MADVARAAGVSRSTVSYVLSGTRPISDMTRERILRAMKELNYTPNVLAQGLAGRRTGIIALIFPLSEVGFNPTEIEYIRAASEQAREDGYNLLLWPFGADEIEEVRKVVNQGLVEGVVLMEVLTADERVPFLIESDIPFTMIGRTADPRDLAYVDTDFEASGSMAVDHVAGLGHTEIGFLARTQDDLDAGHGPAVRTRDAVLAEAGKLGIRAHIFTASPTFPAGWDALKEIRRTAPGLTALLELNEPATLGLMAAAAEQGIRIPEDLSIVAVNASETTAQMSKPALTSVSPTHGDLARLAVKYLVRRLRGEDQSAFQTLVEPKLIERGSTAVARS
ncbi:LacI family DNA-binding transcriptional regulator [Arthrobacter sp. PM3]|uniref:LacI family DNA-binding transcriptional regulator n=1 Tax=Arthrobacter sp. PM3 TaxID=2017685 RepID=UPI001C9B4E1A|nr:LacI family DNA-binding transcriptional regulator [Arthrobacter sp. PM3]